MIKFIVEALVYGLLLTVVLPLMMTLGFFLIMLAAQLIGKLLSFFQDEESIKL